MSTKIFNISLPTEIVRQADQLAKAQFKSRSELIKDALRAYLRDSQVLEDLMAYGKKQGEKMNITSEEQVFDLVS